jgi:hypothetical protein
MPFSEQPKLNSDKGSLKQYPEREVSEGFRALNLRSPNALLESVLAVIMNSLGVKILLNQKRPKSVVALKNFRCNANDFALFERFDCYGASSTPIQICEGTNERLIESNGVAREPPGSIPLESCAEFAGRYHVEKVAMTYCEFSVLRTQNRPSRRAQTMYLCIRSTHDTVCQCARPLPNMLGTPAIWLVGSKHFYSSFELSQERPRV